MAAFVSGTVDSDVYWEDIIWLGEWAQNGYVRPLDDLIKRDFSQADIDDFCPAPGTPSRNGTAEHGRCRSAPTTSSTIIADLFKKAGLNAPVTLDDVDKDAAALNKPAQRQFGIAMPYQRGTAICSWFLATFAGAGGHMLKDPPNDLTPTLDSPLALDVLSTTSPG